MAGLTIGKLAAGEGVGVETVRFYQRRGLLAMPDRTGSGFREYTENDRQRLAFIRRARQLGFSLGEIGDLLGTGDGRSAADVIRAAEAKLATISEQITELTLLQGRLRRLVRVCAHGDSVDCVALHVVESPPGARPDRAASPASEGASAASPASEGASAASAASEVASAASAASPASKGAML
jgi:DNA-binding transcriptional MerR regulator